MPAVSILMTVYNREIYLPDAIESILNQSFRDFEFVIVDDGSTDKSAAILVKYARKDHRIKLITSKKNQGIVKAVGKGLPHCHGNYIARMDSDDISLSDRLKLEYEYLERHQEISAVGTGFDFMDQDGRLTGGYVVRPTDPLQTRYEMLYHCILHNPTTMSKADFYKQFNEMNYENNYTTDADYAFWLRKNSTCFYANIPERLFVYRLHPGRISTTHQFVQREAAVNAAKKAFEELIGRPVAFDVIRAFYFSERVEENRAPVVTKGIRVMLQGYRRFLKKNQVTPEQKKEIRKFTFEKIKSVAAKYKKFLRIRIAGIYALFQISPYGVFNFLLHKTKTKRFQKVQRGSS